MKDGIIEGMKEFFGSIFWYIVAFVVTIAFVGLIEWLFYDCSPSWLPFNGCFSFYGWLFS